MKILNLKYGVNYMQGCGGKLQNVDQNLYNKLIKSTFMPIYNKIGRQLANDMLNNVKRIIVKTI